jgi:hypothetical protein
MSSEDDELLTAMLVTGRDWPGFVGRLSYPEVSFLLFEPGRGTLESAGWPNTRPAAAAATAVPVPTSCGRESPWLAPLKFEPLCYS